MGTASDRIGQADPHFAPRHAVEVKCATSPKQGFINDVRYRFTVYLVQTVYRELEMEKQKAEKEREDSKKKRPRVLPVAKGQPAYLGLAASRLQTGCLLFLMFLSFVNVCLRSPANSMFQLSTLPVCWTSSIR